MVLPIFYPKVGDEPSYVNVELVNICNKKNIFPVFFVKNSSSDLVISALPEHERERYNSDLHWAFKNLKSGQRSPLFRYTDITDESTKKKYRKIFFYLRGYDTSVQRVEMHEDSYNKFIHLFKDLPDYLYYLLLCQGKPENPQIRPIAISEIYAKESLHYYFPNRRFYELELTETMNEVRGMTGMI